MYYCNMIYGAKFSLNYYSIPEFLLLPHMNDGHDGGCEDDSDVLMTWDTKCVGVCTEWWVC